MQKMLQQVMTAPGHIEFREAPVPAPNAGEVLVKIMKIGVCGSDIHVYHGEHPFTKYPVTQGHEVSGKIAALGEGVTGFAIGPEGDHRTAGLLRPVPSVHARQVQSVRGASGDGVPDDRHSQ